MNWLLIAFEVRAGIGGVTTLWMAIQLRKQAEAAIANSDSTPVDEITRQMNEPRPLPMGQKEFIQWSDRILSGALIPSDDTDSLRGVLAAMIMQLPAHESHKADAFFIHALRKAAANEVAHANFQAIKKRKEEKPNAETA